MDVFGDVNKQIAEAQDVIIRLDACLQNSWSQSVYDDLCQARSSLNTCNHRE